MRSKILPILILLTFFAKPMESVAQVNVQDSLALVDFHDNTYGAHWRGDPSKRWDLSTPVSGWNGIGITNNRVTSIKLVGLIDSGRIPSSFGNMTALTSIYFLDDKIYMAPLPESFSNLINLTSLKMSAVFWYLPFPKSITNLPKLTHLDLQDNFFLDSIPSSLGNLTQLQYLDLSRCFSYNGSNLPVELGNLINLQALILTSANISDTIPESLTNLNSLENLDVSGNKLTGYIPFALNNLQKLIYLGLNDNEFTFQVLEPFIQNAHSLNKTYTDLIISPQANININRHQEKLAVSAGGNLSNNTYRWYKTGTGLVATKNGDSTYTPITTGNYYVEVTNSIAIGLTLSSNTINFDFLLADANTTVVQNITGTDTTYINNGFFRIVSIKPIEGANALSGNVSATVTIDPAVKTFNSQPYVQRHYDITPSVNAENAQAIVTLYFTQQDFDNYNNYVIANNLSYPLLPTGGVNNGNVRISQLHGSFTASPDPGNYNSGDNILIKPAVAWDPVNNWWVLTFPVNGFSGFFINTINAALPLTLLQFYGTAEENMTKLRWQTTEEINTKQFIVQHSNNIGFNDIGIIPAQSIRGANNYTFVDKNPNIGNNFYRLKMIDIDGHFTYSDVIKINFSGNGVSMKLYPNPVTAELNVKINSPKAQNINLKITDALGKSVYQEIIPANAGTNSHSINVEKLSAGIYYLNVMINGKLIKASFVKD
ncbi:MAG: T9SS type A sorting domain-containing protein [Ginsengibacter sp.]